MHAVLALVVALVGVNVVAMDSERVLTAQTVIVRDGVIAEIGAVEEIAVPDNAQVVYGRGRWLTHRSEPARRLGDASAAGGCGGGWGVDFVRTAAGGGREAGVPPLHS